MGAVREALAPAVAGGLHAHEPRVHAVLQVAAQDAVLDQHGAPGGRALVVHRERAPAVVDGAIVHHRHPRRGHALAEKAGERAGLLAVEVAFEAMADGLVQQDAGPAGAEHHWHFAGGRRDGFEVDQSLAERLVHLRLPALGREELVVDRAPADALRACLLPLAVVHHDGNVEADERAHVRGAAAVGADDLHRLPGAEKRRHHLPHPWLLGPGVSVDLRQQRDLVVEGRAVQRVVVHVERAVGAGGRCRHGAAVAAADRADRGGRPLERVLAELAGMGVGRGLAGDRAQPETLMGVEARALEAAVVEGEALALAVFEEELAVVGAVQRVRDDPLRSRPVEACAIEEDLVGDGISAHRARPYVLARSRAQAFRGGLRTGAGRTIPKNWQRRGPPSMRGFKRASKTAGCMVGPSRLVCSGRRDNGRVVRPRAE